MKHIRVIVFGFAAATLIVTGGAYGQEAGVEAGSEPIDSSAASRTTVLPNLTGYSDTRIDSILRTSPDTELRSAAIDIAVKRKSDVLAKTLEDIREDDPDPEIRAQAEAAYEKVWPFDRKPRRAAFLSYLLPGAGHFYLRNPGAALWQLCPSQALLSVGISTYVLGYLEIPGASLGLLPLMAGTNLGRYSVFSAYRDARLLRNNRGYRYPVSNESFRDLMRAPFNPDVLKSPWVSVGVPVWVGAAIGLGYLIEELEPELATESQSVFEGENVRFLSHDFSAPAGLTLSGLSYGALFVPVAVGEEAMYRGVIQTDLSETFLGRGGALASGSLIFGLVHVPNYLPLIVNEGKPGRRTAAYSVTFLSLIGAYMGGMSMADGNNLSRSVAFHYWYDFLLSMVSLLIDPQNSMFAARVQFGL